MSGAVLSRRVVLTLLQQSGGSLTLPLNDPAQAPLRRKLQDLASNGRVKLASQSSSTITYKLPTDNVPSESRFQPSDANA